MPILWSSSCQVDAVVDENLFDLVHCGYLVRPYFERLRGNDKPKRLPLGYASHKLASFEGLDILSRE